ncbi:MAG: hypothetical protein KJ645_13045 [Planctomycetes bacterium]|nr:hypothetical protein [Planctomycetota bacterium]
MHGNPHDVFKKRKSRGFNLVEVSICLFLITVSFAAYLGVALQSMQDFDSFTAETQVTQWNQQRVNMIREDTLSVKQYFDRFDNSAMSEDYFNALELPAGSMPINGTLVLPSIEESGLFEPDVAMNPPKTGNALFFVRCLEPFSVRVQMDPNQDDPADWHIYRIPVYTFVVYYLTLRTEAPIGNSSDSLDLIRWNSQTVADYNQVMEFPDLIEDGALECYPREQVVQNFVNTYGSEFIWVSGEELDQAFYRCYADGVIDAGPVPKEIMEIPMDRFDGIFGRMEGNGVNHIQRSSVCKNRGEPGFEVGTIVPQFGLIDNTGNGFPHGFETQIIGPSGARELMIRLALAKQGSKGIISKGFRAVLTTRDY